MTSVRGLFCDSVDGADALEAEMEDCGMDLVEPYSVCTQ